MKVGYLSLGLLSLGMLAFVASAAETRLITARRPNVLLILTDDQRADTIAALGNRVIKTPELDRLVREGTVLTGMICPYPVCTPSRTELLTGMTFMRATAPGAKPETLPEALRANGYHTWYVGKWHVEGQPRTRGFEASNGRFGTSAKMKLPPVERDQRGNPITGYRGTVFMNDGGEEFPERGVGLTPNISERFADAAIELIRRRPERPFFLQVNFTAPHDPRMRPPGYEKAYRPDAMPLPGNFSTKPSFDSGNLNTRDERLLPKPLDPVVLRDELSIYYALLSHVDAQVGRMIAVPRHANP